MRARRPRCRPTRRLLHRPPPCGRRRGAGPGRSWHRCRSRRAKPGRHRGRQQHAVRGCANARGTGGAQRSSARQLVGDPGRTELARVGTEGLGDRVDEHPRARQRRALPGCWRNATAAPPKVVTSRASASAGAAQGQAAELLRADDQRHAEGRAEDPARPDPVDELVVGLLEGDDPVAVRVDADLRRVRGGRHRDRRRLVAVDGHAEHRPDRSVVARHARLGADVPGGSAPEPASVTIR